MMKLEFLPKALETYNQVKQCNPDIVGKIKTVLKDTLSHPESGLGEPIRLVGEYQGIWQRRLSFEEAVFYAFNDEKVLVISLSAGL